MTWNVDGFGYPARRLLITTYLWEQSVDIAIITETHLTDEDIYKEVGEKEKAERIMLIQLDHYRLIHWRNRESSVKYRCGGVLILARPGIDCS